MALHASRMLRECKRVGEKSRKEFLGQTVKKNYTQRKSGVQSVHLLYSANALSISREAGDSPPVLHASVLFRGRGLLLNNPLLFRGGAYYLTTPPSFFDPRPSLYILRSKISPLAKREIR